jgi:ADP-heptose:LPS heptosyltransferase
MPKDFSRHAIDQNAAVLERLGIPVLDRVPKLKVDPVADETVAAMLRERGMPERGFVVVHPFTAWRTKEWPEERYAAVLGEAPMRDRPVVLTGAMAELARSGSLAGRARHPRILNLAGQLTLGQSLALWSRAGLFLGGDTGPLHASVALGVRAVALYGPTRVEATGPAGDGTVVIQESVPEHHEAYRSPDGVRHMLAITEDKVIAALERALT